MLQPERAHEEEKQLLPEEDEFFDVPELAAPEAEEEPVFYDVQEYSCTCPNITPIRAYAFASATSAAFNAMLGPSGWNAEQFGNSPSGWIDSMPLWKTVYSFVAMLTSLDINTKFAEYFVPEAFHKLHEDFSDFYANNPVKKVISTASGFFAAIPFAMITYESFAWLQNVANTAWSTTVGSIMGLAALTNTTASRKIGIDRFFDCVSGLFSRTEQAKKKFIAQLKHLSAEQRETFESELEEKHFDHLPKTQEESEAFIEALHNILTEHDWHRSDNWLEISAQIFDAALATLMFISSAPIFFEKGLSGIALIAGKEALANSPIFLKWLIGSLGSISSCLYFISALSMRESIWAALKTDPRFAILTILKNIPAGMAMFTVAKGVLNKDNFFGLTEETGFGSALPYLAMLSAILTNLYSCIGLWKKTRQQPEEITQAANVDNIITWLENKSHLTQEEMAPIRRTISFFKELSEQADRPLKAPLLQDQADRIAPASP
ncbi:MAG: hypothetical protein SFW66_03430 [Gammaproteobacteria bacterium]|nr:hypothetical protein [Gammaproteobacteria bacterium]